MQLACPKCGTREVRVSQRSGFLEAMKGLIGVYPLRCRRCRNRWLTSAWAHGAWKFARCPRCYRQELTTWSEQYYHPKKWIVLKLRLGAIPYRCAACRCNFAGFKPCKEKFSWRHETKVNTRKPARVEDPAAVSTGSSSALVNGTTPVLPLKDALLNGTRAAPDGSYSPAAETQAAAHEVGPVLVGEPANLAEDESPEPYL